VAYVPGIEGCHALSSTPQEAQSELQNVFEMIAEEIAERGAKWPNDVILAAQHAS